MGTGNITLSHPRLGNVTELRSGRRHGARVPSEPQCLELPPWEGWGGWCQPQNGLSQARSCLWAGSEPAPWAGSDRQGVAPPGNAPDFPALLFFPFWAMPGHREQISRTSSCRMSWARARAWPQSQELGTSGRAGRGLL